MLGPRFFGLRKKIKRKSLTTLIVFLSVLLVMNGINAKAFIFKDAKEIVEIFPMDISGDWANEIQATFLPEVGEKDDSMSFSDFNSATYEGGAKSIHFSDFSVTRDELESLTLEGMTEDEEMMNNLQPQLRDDDVEFYESILEQEMGAPQSSLDFLDTGQSEDDTESLSETEQTPRNFLMVDEIDGGSLNVRDIPSTEGEIVGKIKQGEAYEYTQEQDDWYLISIDEEISGWVSGEYVMITQEPEIKESVVESEQEKETMLSGNFLEIAQIDTNSLNVRNIPSAEGQIIGKAEKGGTYEYLQEQDDWYQIILDEGKKGWVSGEFIIVKNNTTEQIDSEKKESPESASAEKNLQANAGDITASQDRKLKSFLGKVWNWFKGNEAEAQALMSFGDLVGKKITNAKLKMSFAIVKNEGQFFPDSEMENILQEKLNKFQNDNESTGEKLNTDEPSTDTESVNQEKGPAIDVEASADENISSRKTNSLIMGKIRSLFGISQTSAQTESVTEEDTTAGNNIVDLSSSLDTDIDAKIIIKYSLDGGESWEKLETITRSSISNAENGGYFTFDAPFLKKWEDLENLQVKIEGAVGGETNFTAYLDSLWAEMEYQDASGNDPQMHLQKESWQKSQSPVVDIMDIEDDASVFEETWKGMTEFFGAETEELELEVKLTSPAGGEVNLEKDKDFVVENLDTLKIEILPDEEFLPGKYEVEVTIKNENGEYYFKDEFTWGVLAVNTNKSVYTAEDKAYVQMAALDETGHTLCDADLKIEIQNPDGNASIFKTEDGSIEKSDSCGANNVTDNPDYFFRYQVGGEGEYKMRLVNIGNGFEIADSFEVRESVPIEVERVGATRINPFKAEYVMTFNVKAKEDFNGKIIETVPEGFEISEISNNGAIVGETNQSQELIWSNISLKKGNELELKYRYQAPKISPQLYLLGSAKFTTTSRSFLEKFTGNSEELTVFEEARQWQIASDASGEQLDNPSFSGGSTNWTLSAATYDSATYQDTAGSMQTFADRKGDITGLATQNGYDSYLSTDTVTFSCFYKNTVSGNGNAQFMAQIAEVGTPTTWTTIWDSGVQYTSFDWTSTGSLNVSSFFGTGSYRIRLSTRAIGGAAGGSSNYGWFDNCSLNIAGPPAITVSGTSTLSSGTVNVAVNSAIQTGKSGTISGGNWSIPNIDIPASGDIITVWVAGAGETDESTAIGRYSGSGDMTAMVLNPNTLSVGGVGNQSVSVANLCNATYKYDNTINEDVMHTCTGTTLAVKGNNTYSAEVINILGTDTLVVSGTEILATHDMVITGILSSGGASVYNITRNWTNNGSFVQSSSGVNLSGTTAQTIGGSTTTTFNNLTISNTSVAVSANANFVVNGNLTLNANTILTPGATAIVSGTGTLTGSGTAQVTRIAATADFVTQYSISNKTLTSLTVAYVASSAQTINALNYFNLTSSSTGARTLASSGTIGVAGTFTPGTNSYTITGSTINFNGTLAQTVPADFIFNDLQVKPTADSITSDFASGTVTVNGNFTVGNGTNTGIVVNANTNNTTLNVSGAFNVSANTSFVANDSNMLAIGGDFTSYGTFNGGSANIIIGTDGTTNGDFTLESGSVWNAGLGTLILDGGADGNEVVFEDKNGTKQNIGNVQIGASPAATNMSSDMSANSLTVATGDKLNTRGFDLDIATYVTVNGTLNATNVLAGNGTNIKLGTTWTVGSGAIFTAEESDTTPTTVIFDESSSGNIYPGGIDENHDFYNIQITKSSSSTITLGAEIHVENDLIISNSNSTLDTNGGSSYAIAVGGSWSNGGTFTANSGTVTFDSADTGESIEAGSSSFNNVVFNNSGGGWTIQTDNLTASNDFTITDTAVSGFTVDSVTVEINGTYSIADIETSNTTWTSATLYLNSANSYTIGSKTQNAEAYSTLQIGANTHIRMWESTATTYTVDSSGSLYSQDHANASGDLYIWGDYHVNTDDYWEYANDFDGTSSANRQVDVRIDPSAKVTVESGATLGVVGDSVNRTTVSRQGSSDGYEISSLSGSTINFQYTDFDYLDGPFGLDIQSGSVVSYLRYNNFDNLVGTAGTADAFITVASSVIGSGSKTINGVNFDNTGSGAEFNVNRTGDDESGFWDFNASTGTFDGEVYDGDDGVNEADPGMLKWDDSAASGVTVDGIVYSDEGTTPYLCSTTGNLTIDVRVNGAGSYTAECNQDTGDFSVFGVTIGGAGDVLTIFVNEDDVGSVYATTVTRANDATSDITANLYQNHVNIRHEDGGPITIDNLDNFDNGNDSDVKFTATNSTPDTLLVNDGQELYILGSMTFTPGGDVTVDDIEILGSYTATGAETIIVSGSWVNSGIFTAASSIVTFDATSGTESINSTGASTATFNDFILGSGSGTASWNLGSALDVDGDLTIDYGILEQGTNNITLDGDLAINSNGAFSSGGGLFTFDGTTTPVTWTNTTIIDDLGAVTIDGTAKIVNLNSSAQATSLAVGDDDVIALGDSGYILTLSGSGTAGARPFIVNNASSLDEGADSTMKYAGTGDTEIENETYHNLELSPLGGSGPAYTLGTAATQTIKINNNLTVGDGTNTVTVSAATHDPTLNIDGDLLISNGGALTASGAETFNVGGSWSNAGTFTHSSGTVTFDSGSAGETIVDGGSAFYDLVFSGSGGEWLYVDGTATAPNSTLVSNGTPTFLNAKTGAVSVTGGTLNQDWYLGTHLVNAAQTATNIDTGDNEITISEATSASTVWKHNGSDWGTASNLQTTGTGSDGKNPQPNNSGAIRIREYSMTDHATCPGAGCTIYKYNEQIDWVNSYGEYDYHDDYGEKYLTSCWAGSSSACFNDSEDDDTIGVNWHRATIGTMNTPYDGVNESPTQGSWYVGMLEALNFTIDTFTRDFGTLTPGDNPTDLTNKITVTTSASHGYVVYARTEEDMTCSSVAACGTAYIPDWPDGNDAPTTWSGGSFGFGYSTNDYNLQGGTPNRFSGPNFAGFTELGFGDPVADRDGPSSAQENDITYRIAAPSVQTAGSYQTSVYYIVVPIY